MKKSKNKLVSPSDPLNPVTFRLGEDLRAAVELEAEERGITLGEVCRELVQEGMKDSPKRHQSELLRSLAITRQQLVQFAEAEKSQEKSWWDSGARYEGDARDIVEAIEGLERRLKEAE